MNKSIIRNNEVKMKNSNLPQQLKTKTMNTTKKKTDGCEQPYVDSDGYMHPYIDSNVDVSIELKEIKNDNQHHTEQKMNKYKNRNLVSVVDKLIMERLPDYFDDELKWIRKEYGDDEISEFLCGNRYFYESPLLRKIDSVIEELYKG